jgi:hypothetical protein
MWLDKQFHSKLDELWSRRTARIRSVVTPQGVGHPKIFTKALREKHINELLEIASRILLKRQGRKEFARVVESRHLKHISGHGLLARGDDLLAWAGAKLHGPIVYAFWSGKKCLYVGKGSSWKRLHCYEKSAYLLQARCIEVFCVTGQSQLGKAECLATHLFGPRDNKMKASKVKWGKACPICKKHDEVRRDLKMK